MVGKQLFLVAQLEKVRFQNVPPSEQARADFQNVSLRLMVLLYKHDFIPFSDVQLMEFGVPLCPGMVYVLGNRRVLH